MDKPESILKLNIDLLIPNTNQPRKAFNEETLKELAESIKEFGILNPILVRKKDNKYEIIAGERRFRAAKIAKLNEVPVIIKNISDNQLSQIALIENLQRENLSPIEEAKSYQEILKTSSLTEEKLSNIIGKSQAFISNKLRLLKLSPNIQEALIKRKISEKHARSLLMVKDENKQTELLEKIIKEKLSVKELDNLINENKITDEEIKSAINDIMESLKINDYEEKKEEKESDKMNNGSFFPNINNNQESSNATLNSMNMQTMMPPQPEIIDSPQVQNPIPNFGFTPEPATMEPQNQPSITEQVAVQGTEATNQGEVPIIPQEPVSTNENIAPPIMDIPLFSETNNIENPVTNQPLENQEVPKEPNTFIPVMPEMNATNLEVPVNSEPVIDTPLFNQNINSNPVMENQEVPSQPTNNEAFSVPVTTEPVNQNDKLTVVTNLLNSNNIEYEQYSNETGHCIIIKI